MSVLCPVQLPAHPILQYRGGVHNICSDKTGTITVGRMVLQQAWIPVNAAFVPPGERASYETATGQLYAVESAKE